MREIKPNKQVNLKPWRKFYLTCSLSLSRHFSPSILIYRDLETLCSASFMPEHTQPPYSHLCFLPCKSHRSAVLRPGFTFFPHPKRERKHCRNSSSCSAVCFAFLPIPYTTFPFSNYPQSEGFIHLVQCNWKWNSSHCWKAAQKQTHRYGILYTGRLTAGEVYSVFNFNILVFAGLPPCGIFLKKEIVVSHKIFLKSC